MCRWQIGLLGLQMIWTRDSEVALQLARTDKKIMMMTSDMFLDILNEFIEVTTQELTRMERTKYETLITIHVHQKDIFDDLVRFTCKSPATLIRLKTNFYPSLLNQSFFWST